MEMIEEEDKGDDIRGSKLEIINMINEAQKTDEQKKKEQE